MEIKPSLKSKTDNFRVRYKNPLQIFFKKNLKLTEFRVRICVKWEIDFGDNFFVSNLKRNVRLKICPKF